MNRFEHRAAAAAINLRDYQQQCVDALVREVNDPRRATNNITCSVATGGGKRLICAELLRRWALPADRRVLIVTALGWRLLAQLAETFCQREREGDRLVSFVGGRDAQEEFPGIRQGVDGPIVFTSSQTWASRRQTDFTDPDFDAIVIDEVHHGEGALMHTALEERYPRAIFIGFTGTPRNWTDHKLVGNVSFAALVERGHLARPVVHPPVRTGVRWNPQRSSPHGDVTTRSLAELGANEKRNRLIVATYLRSRSAFGKTLVFCCNIAHAEQLNAMFTVAGVRSGVVHCKQDYSTRLRTQDALKDGRLEVVTNVMTMAVGVDLPDLQTVFLARPTWSEVLFAQMVGRGARRTPTKTTFSVVDFVDAIPEDGLDLIRPDGFLGTGRPLRCPLITSHEFAPAELEMIHGAPGYEALEGLEIVPTQTFGVEIEATGRDRAGNVVVPYSAKAAQKVLNALHMAGLPTAKEPLMEHSFFGRHAAKDNSLWNIEPDPTSGWEVTSRILRGRDGMGEIVDACGVLAKVFEELGLRVDDKRVGCHIHLGWDADFAALQQLAILGAFYEPAFLSLVAPSRARNRYVHSMRNRSRVLLSMTTLDMWKEYFAGNRRKHLAVNPGHVLAEGGYGTVEVRHHSGTVDAAKIVAWISLWMRVLATARQPNARPGSPYARPRTLPLCKGERGDVALMCDRLGVGAALRARLVVRRDKVVSNWWRRDERYAQLAMSLLEEWERNPATVPIADRAAE